MIAKEACVSAQRGGVHAGENKMARTVDYGTLALGVRTPEDEDEVVTPYVQFTDDGIGEFLPALPLVRGCSMSTNSKGGIEQQHTLIGPAGKVTIRRWRGTEVVLNLLEYVNQRGRHGGRRTDGKAHAVGLPRLMIGILSKKQQSDIVERRCGEGAENLLAGRKYLPRSIFAIKKSLQGVQINALDF